MIVLLILHPPLRILSLTSKIPGSASLCRLRFPPDCGTGNQPAENRRRSIKPCRPHPAFYTAPRKRLVLIVTGNPVRFRRHRNWTLRLYAKANDAPVSGAFFAQGKRLLDFRRKSGVHRCKGIAGKTTIHSDYQYNIMQKFVNYFFAFYSQKQ